MKKLLVLLALLFAPVITSASVGVDGAWFDSGCFGCPNDTVKDEVIEAQSQADAAESQLESDRSIANLENAIGLALFSYVKAGHALEIADNYRADGNAAEAIKWYEQTIEYSNAAIKMPSNASFVGRKGQNVPEKSHEEGKKWKGYAQRRLAKLKPAAK